MHRGCTLLIIYTYFLLSLSGMFTWKKKNKTSTVISANRVIVFFKGFWRAISFTFGSFGSFIASQRRLFDFILWCRTLCWSLMFVFQTAVSNSKFTNCWCYTVKMCKITKKKCWEMHHFLCNSSFWPCPYKAQTAVTGSMLLLGQISKTVRIVLTVLRHTLSGPCVHTLWLMRHTLPHTHILLCNYTFRPAWISLWWWE